MRIILNNKTLTQINTKNNKKFMKLMTLIDNYKFLNKIINYIQKN